MASVCLPSDAVLQHLQSYLGFSYLGRGVTLQGCSSKVQPLLLTLDEGYLLTAAPPDLEHGVAPLGPPAPAQPPLLGCGVSLLGCSSKVQPLLLTLDEEYLLTATPPDLERGIAPLGPSFACAATASCTWGCSSQSPPLTYKSLNPHPSEGR